MSPPLALAPVEAPTATTLRPVRPAEPHRRGSPETTLALIMLALALLGPPDLDDHHPAPAPPLRPRPEA